MQLEYIITATLDTFSLDLDIIYVTAWSTCCLMLQHVKVNLEAGVVSINLLFTLKIKSPPFRPEHVPFDGTGLVY